MDTLVLNVVATAIFLAVGGYFLYRRYVSLPKAWQVFADDNLLTLERKGGLKTPEVTGNFHARPFRLFCYVVSSGSNSSTTYCRMELTMSPGFSGRLELSHEGVVARMGKALFKTEDIQLQDPDFDPNYIIKCSHKELPGQLLKGRTREKLLEFSNWWFSWEGEAAQATRMGVEHDGQDLRNIAGILSEVAAELENESDSL